jgi:hypothetical protein
MANTVYRMLNLKGDKHLENQGRKGMRGCTVT